MAQRLKVPGLLGEVAAEFAGTLILILVGCGGVAEVVAETVVAAAIADRPKRRYTAGKAAKQISFARRFVPAEMFDKSLRKQFGLPA